MIIAPQKAFLIDYKLNNPSDTDTHYVRVVITNSISGVVLDTLNLTDNGNKYFSKSWVTPVDVSGTGLQITMTKTVYDDPAYTVESLVYGTNVETYIVKDVAGVRTLFGGTGGGHVDYKEVRKIIREEIDSTKTEKSEKYDDSKIHNHLSETREHLLGKLDEEKQELAQIKTLITQVVKEEISKAVSIILNSKELNAIKELPSKFKEAEISDDNLHEFITDTMNDVQDKVDEISEKIEDYGKESSKITKELKAIEKRQNNKEEMVKKIKLKSEELSKTINDNLNAQINEIVNGKEEDEEKIKEDADKAIRQAKRQNVINKLLFAK